MHIKIRKGLNIPVEGEPSGAVSDAPATQTVALDVDLFSEVKFKVLVKIGDQVKLGQPLLHDKAHPEIVFTSPAGGTLKEIRRGLKRRLLSLIIEVDGEEEVYPFDADASLAEMGLFAHIRMRPFDRLANPTQTPKAIFVRALESAPFLPPPELQIEGNETYFQAGLSRLAQIAPVHLVSRTPWSYSDCENHTAQGPHPIANASIHIQKISPIKAIDEVVWTLGAHDVLCIGHMIQTRRPFTTRVIGVSGKGYLRVRNGIPLCQFAKEGHRLISGDPLTGRQADPDDYLGFNHFAISRIPMRKKRQFLHFLRLSKYTATHTYFSPRKHYPFTTSLHGEERAFIDGHIYDKVMPLSIPTMPLIKSILAQDWELAEQLGLLEVASEDFALPTFICPSKIEMFEIVKEGLLTSAAEFLH